MNFGSTPPMDLVALAAVRRAQEALSIVGGQRRENQFSFVRMIERMEEGKLDGFELETLQTVAMVRGETFDRFRPVVPWEQLMARDLSTASPSSGGYLVDSASFAALDALRPYSVTARAWISIAAGLNGNAEQPRTTSHATINWLNGEAAQATPSTPAVGSIGLSPKTACAVVEFSRNFSLQANAEAFARRELLGTAGAAVDQAVLSGSGLSGQPLGILNVPGIGSTSGSSLGQTGVVEMKRKVSDANAPDAGIGFIATPAVRELLEKRERATGLGFVWDNDRVASRPAAVSTLMPSATMVAAYWPSVYLYLWGPGFAIEINPFDGSGFKFGKIQARVMVSCDVAAAHPAAICAASSIS